MNIFHFYTEHDACLVEDASLCSQTITSRDGKEIENRNVGLDKGRNEHRYVNGKRKRR
jgi:hypothetical protein